ncbi:hypothetical protein GCM10009792_25480 [Microcella alkalica]|uniref:Uncharacterized protein n=1 Tax=Microcella alkalica TaxID=355930 RepID=A0A839E8U0_9MICO|nr:hypothetical protein [Microcella alkalica]MBA8847686.1 hypothetical protein [Microcella alkalica]
MSEQGELDAARRRELERRAFARPRDEASVADAAVAAAELAALRPPAPPPSVARPARPPGGPPAEDDPDDPDDERTWLAAASAVVLARLRSSSRSERRDAAIGAGALVILTGILVAAHIALTAPPPAFADFEGDQPPQRDATGQWDLADETVRTQLEGRGIDIVSGPVVFGEPSRDPRLIVYRQWVSESIVEVCGGIVVDGAFFTAETCTSDEVFRSEGLEGAYDDGAFSVEFSWSPEGTPSLEVLQQGAVTLDEVRALGILALAALEADPTPADALIWNYAPDTIAGPLLLAEIDGVQYVGLLSADDDSIGRLGDAPTFCLWIADRESNGGGCTTAERFAVEGIEVLSDGVRARWLPSGELVRVEP